MRFLILILVLLISACSNQQQLPFNDDQGLNTNPSIETGLFCSPEWFRYVETQLNSSDSMGHGPDLGSEEWQSVIEFKLGLRSQSNLPSKHSTQWCEFIQAELNSQRSLPTFSCQDKTLNNIEKEICQSQELSSLDIKMSTTFKSALEKTSLNASRQLKAEQRGWIKARNECWKFENVQSCIVERYQYRIAELTALYNLIDALGPVFYVCDGRPTDEVIVKFFPTEPLSILAERAGQESFMILQETASGSKYQGRNEIFWDHQGKASVIWGINAEEMTCERMH